MIKIDYIKADCRYAEKICSPVQSTIREVYPKYYPKEIVEFFCGLHNLENISRDISDGQVYVLIINGEIIGTGSAMDSHITRVYVLPKYQRMGYGSQIIRELEILIAQSFDHTLIDASLPTVHMYEHLGYKTLRQESMELQNGTVLVYDIMRKDL